MAYVYPTGSIDQPALLTAFLGSHWASAWSNSHQIESLMQTRGREEYQKVIDLGEAADSVSRLTVPVYHTDHWQLLVLKESEKNSDKVAILRYDEPVVDAVYGNDPLTGYEYKYGVPQNLYSMFPIPSDIREIPFIFNRITRPSFSMTHGLNYFIDEIDSGIVFRDDPFSNPLVAVRDVYENGEVVDREALLWLFRSQLETDNIYQQFGYVLDMRLESSSEYRGYVNAIWDGIVEGTGGKQIEDAVASLTDTPVVQSDGEIVKHILDDHHHQLVITDKAVYRYPIATTAIVSVDDVVNAGQQLVDTVQIFEFHDGTVPAVADLVALEVGRGYLVTGFSGGITFHNKTVPLEVDTSGIFTRVEFDVGGFVGDVAEFWDQFHARGIANPPTLAQLLDQRTVKTGEPTAGALPATINPLEFLIQNVLRNNVFVVKIRVNKQGPDRVPLSHSQQLRKIVPPHTAMIFVTELAVDEEIITMGGPGDDTEPGFAEAPVTGFALEPITETLNPSTLITEAPVLKYVEGICL